MIKIGPKYFGLSSNKYIIQISAGSLGAKSHMESLGTACTMLKGQSASTELQTKPEDSNSDDSDEDNSSDKDNNNDQITTPHEKSLNDSETIQNEATPMLQDFSVKTISKFCAYKVWPYY